MRSRPQKKQRVLTREEKLLAEQGWSELGASLAATVVHGGKSQSWAWQILKPLSIYPHWMLLYWIEKCKKASASNKRVEPRAVGRPPSLVKKSEESIFSSREELNEALYLLSQGVSADDVISRYNRKSQG